MSSRQDRRAGLLLGLAAGDRIGGPTQMALALAESLAEFDDYVEDDVAARYLSWWRRAGFDTGPTAEAVFRLVESGYDFHDAAESVHRDADGMTAGCNPLHRSLPLALLASPSDSELTDMARSNAKLTHCHELAGETAAAMVLLARQLIRGDDWHQALAVLPDDDWRLLPAEPTGFAPAVANAAITILSERSSFSDALERAVAYAGPANYCPVVVGALAGARWGAKSIAEDQLTHVAAADIERIRAGKVPGSFGSCLAFSCFADSKTCRGGSPAELGVIGEQ